MAAPPPALTLPSPSADDCSCDAPQILSMGTQQFHFPRLLERMPFELDNGSPDFYALNGETLSSGARKLSLPVFFRVEVFPPTDDTECILIATSNRCLNGRGGDGFTVYSSVHRTDFTFRTRVYEGPPRRIQIHNDLKLRTQEWNEIAWLVGEEKTVYWINRQRRATCYLQPEDLPGKELYFGLAAYDTAYKVRRCDASRDPFVLRFLAQHVVTLSSALVGAGIVIVCTSMSGKELARLPIGLRPTVFLRGTHVTVTREIKAMVCVHVDGCWLYLPASQAGAGAEEAEEEEEEEEEEEDDEEDEVGDDAVMEDLQGFPRDALTKSLRPGQTATVDKEPQYFKLDGSRQTSAWIRAEDLSAVMVSDHVEERLIDFRTRLAAQLGCTETEFKLALVDGTFLGDKDDSLPLRTWFQSSAAES